VDSPRPKNRILMIVESLPLGKDQRLKKQVQALLDEGYHVSVICRRSTQNDPYRALPSLRLVEHPSPPHLSGKMGFLVEYSVSWLMAAVLTAAVFCRFGFDAIQVCCPPDIYFPIAIPFKLLGRRFIVDQRDLSPEVFADRYGRSDGFFQRILQKLERISYRSADHVICVNDSLKRVILDRGGKDETEVSVVGNGPILASLPTVVEPPRRETGRLVCCWLGVMGPQDHVDVVLAVAQDLVHRRGRRDCHFMLVGAGESLSSLRELSSDLGLDDWVTFTGWLDEDDVNRHIAEAAIGMDTNLQEEVTPVKGMLYMAFRLPMVAFDLRETRAMAGEAALYAISGDPGDLADRVVALLDDPDRRRRMGAIGRHRVERYLSWELQRDTYLAVFQRLLHPNTDGSGTPNVMESRGRLLNEQRL
jgi:glycosyltransferase involved in cell wall biosynthesis